MLRTLYLVRHAKSSWTDMTLGDFDRPLNSRGLRDAPEMGRRMKLRNIRPDLVLCSPARRTRQTVELLLRELGVSNAAVQFVEAIYEASIADLLHLVRSIPDPVNSAMIVGHNPSIGCLVDQLSGQRLERMPTCAVATLEADTDHWKAFGSQTARLIDFDYPRRSADSSGL